MHSWATVHYQPFDLLVLHNHCISPMAVLRSDWVATMPQKAHSCDQSVIPLAVVEQSGSQEYIRQVSVLLWRLGPKGGPGDLDTSYTLY